MCWEGPELLRFPAQVDVCVSFPWRKSEADPWRLAVTWRTRIAVICCEIWPRVKADPSESPWDFTRIRGGLKWVGAKSGVICGGSKRVAARYCSNPRQTGARWGAFAATLGEWGWNQSLLKPCGAIFSNSNHACIVLSNCFATTELVSQLASFG
jgi:hypothetical protein